jgi:large subunit ribosomal protein L44e
MKVPKLVKRYCKYCKKHTEHKITQVSSGGRRGSLRRGGKARVRMRGLNRGMGSHGRYSKPAMGKWKRKTKATKKSNFLYTCKVCGKSIIQKKGTRASKITFKEK